MAYSLDSLSDSCYPGTTVLINRYNIQEEAQLADVEALIVSAKSAQLETSPLSGNFNFEHYKLIHKFLFGDLYEWAGQIRTVDISKKGTRFCSADQIEDRAFRIFDRLKDQNYLRSFGQIDFVKELVDFYCSTNELHPFREGNGRAQRAFITQLIRFAGHDIDFSDMDGDLLMIATIKAASGVNDLLLDLFTEAIR